VTVVLGIRHGLVDNPHNLVYGRLPGFPLSASGREGAARLAERMSSAPVTAVYSSPLERAMDTAEALAAPHGVPVLLEDRLIEWIGRVAWQGLVWPELIQTEEFARVIADPVANCPEDPLDAAGERVLAWAQEAGSRHEGVVLGVSHEATVVAGYLVARGEGFSRFKATNVPHLQAVRFHPGPPELVDPAKAALSGG
jgi:broad specificity phosphatase PhoE